MILSDTLFMIFYVSFFVSVAFLGSSISSGDVGLSADFSPVPDLDESNLTLLSYLIYMFDWAVYFLGLQGLTVVGLPVIVGAALGTILDFIALYVVVRLIRGV